MICKKRGEERCCKKIIFSKSLNLNGREETHSGIIRSQPNLCSIKLAQQRRQEEVLLAYFSPRAALLVYHHAYSLQNQLATSRLAGCPFIRPILALGTTHCEGQGNSGAFRLGEELLRYLAALDSQRHSPFVCVPAGNLLASRDLARDEQQKTFAGRFLPLSLLSPQRLTYCARSHTHTHTYTTRPGRVCLTI